MLSQRAVVPFAIALAALAFAATPGGAPAAATCPQGVLDPVKGQAPYRDFLNRNWTGDGSVTGNPLECKSTLGPRTLLTSASLTDSTYYVEDNLTIATGETLTLPAGKTIRDCPSSVGGELCNGYSTGTGDLIVDGTAEIDGSFLDYKGKGIVVDAGGTLKSTDGTFAKTTHSAGWNGIAFKAGSKGSLTGATISYADGGVSVAGASTKV
ncbi:MAG TPA: hypothetical protein VFA66_06430, partial [Gaiellaceae bacterium]|nr:hypothetical protein [Gaiellaceae bacterium]